MNLKNVKQPNRLWVGDITYIPIQPIKFGYLAVLMDRFSRRIVGWKLGADMTEKIVITSSKAAIRNRKPKTEMIHHSDRGGQYAGKEYRKIIKHAGMKQSMSRARDCYDNAFMESCFGTIKNELEMTEYKNYNDALKDIRDYIATTISISNAKPVQTKFQLKLRDRVAP
jgi:transposase InsO family protein